LRRNATRAPMMTMGSYPRVRPIMRARSRHRSVDRLKTGFGKITRTKSDRQEFKLGSTSCRKFSVSLFWLIPSHFRRLLTLLVRADRDLGKPQQLDCPLTVQ
jgi:hypothetical protein